MKKIEITGLWTEGANGVICSYEVGKNPESELSVSAIREVINQPNDFYEIKLANGQLIRIPHQYARVVWSPAGAPR